MTAPTRLLADRFRAALSGAFAPEYAAIDPVIRPSQFADYQANVALALGKRLGLPPREVAERLVEHLDVADVCEPAEVSGPGFVNLTLLPSGWPSSSPRWPRTRASASPSRSRRPWSIDYSAPNVAKEMHVGHLRTTVVGDALARTLEHLGHQVIRQNHIGDWGTPFGMLIEHLLDVGEDSAEARLAGRATRTPSTRRRGPSSTRDRGVRRPGPARGWCRCRPGTRRPCGSGASWSTCPRRTSTRIYADLDVTLTDEDLAGECSYNESCRASATSSSPTGIADPSATVRCASSSTATPAARASRCR